MTTTPYTWATGVPIASLFDDETTKAAVRHEFGSLDDAGLPGPAYTRDQARAEQNLHAGIRAAYDDGVTVPCLTDPATWDADTTIGRVTREDVFRAAQLCRTACPVFERCTAFLATKPPVVGIVAGRFVKHPSEVRHERPATNLKDDWATGATTADAA
ncbi:hypothetical protein [Kribbella italica]|uniref:4Fe-4S Wbl-type domain-containing protein n=1 Tax=Kribbella italica TaxID=1540520 RepID=A0A7W9MY30_9ACTN|nr:hypothetical protein [Kribbella italica]MBB5840000.1 hypothetical protein [Kribbella italica]